MRLRRGLPCAVLSACLTGCGGVDAGVRIEGPAATTIPWTGPVFVTDSFGRAWQRPKQVVATRNVSLDKLKWRAWGPSRVLGTGVAEDFNCMSGCPEGDSNPPTYRVDVVLSKPVRRGDVAFYSHLTLTPVHPPAPFWATGSDDTDLEVPDA